MEFDNDTDAEPSEFEVRLKRLKQKHGEDLKEFKLKVWAKMLVLLSCTSVTWRNDSKTMSSGSTQFLHAISFSRM